MMPMPVMDSDAPQPPIEARVLSLYREHGKHLFGYAFGLLGRRADAEDVVQDAFLRLSEHVAAGGPDSNLRAWLFRVTTNLCRDILRSRRRVAGSLPERQTSDGDVLRALAIRRVLAGLEIRDRTLVALRGLGLSYAEISVAAGVNPASVGKLLARALERFSAGYRREFEKEVNEHEVS